MTPNEIITEALYNIYGSSTPEESVSARAASLMERLHAKVQKEAPWWFLERVLTCPAVNSNIRSFKPDGMLDFDSEIYAICCRNGVFVILTKESDILWRIYSIDPKTLTVQKGGSLTRKPWQDNVELRNDEVTGKLYCRLEDGAAPSRSSRIYEITEDGDIIRIAFGNSQQLTMNKCWDIRDGVLYYLTRADSETEWNAFQSIKKLTTGEPTTLVSWIIDVDDLCAVDDALIVTRGGNTGVGVVTWIPVTTGVETVLSSRGAVSTDKLARSGENVYIASKQTDSDRVRVRWFDSTRDVGVPEYIHKGAVNIYTYKEGSLISESYNKNTIYFVHDDYIFVAQRNTDGTGSILRLTDEKVGSILEIRNSSFGRVERVCPGASVLRNASGQYPICYTDVESDLGKRDISFYPQSQYDTVQMRAIIYTDYDAAEEDVVCFNLEEYLVKKLTAELSLTTEYPERYAAFSAAADMALGDAIARNCDFDAQEVTPGYADA